MYTIKSASHAGEGAIPSFYRYSVLVAMCVVLLFVAACNGTAETTPDPTGGPPGTTPLAPEDSTQPYTEPTEPITLENISQIRELGRLDPPGVVSTVFQYAFSPDGTRLVGLNNTLMVAWDLLTGEVVFSNSRGTVTWVFYSSDKTEVYAINGENGIEIYNTERGERVDIRRGMEETILEAVYYGDEDLLALTGESGQVKVWDMVERQSLVTFQSNAQYVTAMAFSEDSTQLATAGSDGIITVWDWREKTALMTFDHEGTQINKLLFSPDGTQLAASTAQYPVIWSLESGELLYTLQADEPVQEMAIQYTLNFSPDSDYLVSGGHTNSVNIWNTKTGELIGTLPEIGGDRLSTSFSADGNLLTASVLNGPVTLWNISQITESGIGRANVDFGEHNIISSAWSEDGYTLALFDATGPVYIWGIAEAE